MGQYEKGLSYSHSSKGSATEGPECISTALVLHLLQARSKYKDLQFEKTN